MNRVRDARAQLSFALAIALAALLFRESARTIEAGGAALAAWSALAIVWLAARRKAPPAGAQLAAFTIAIVLGALLFDHREYARRILAVIVTWAPLLLVVYAASLARKWREVLLAAVSTAIACGALSLAGPSLLKMKLRDYNLDIDHRHKPFDENLKTNEDGVACPLSPRDFNAGDYNIIFLGDSFTLGKSVAHPFPQLVGEELARRYPDARVRSVNFGWTSSSPVLQVRQLLDIGAKYKPKLVVQAFDMTDFHDDIKYTRWFRKRGVDKTADITIFEVAWTVFNRALGVSDVRRWLRAELRFAAPPVEDELREPDHRFFALEQPYEQIEPLLDVSWQAILKTRAAAKSLGADYVLFILPRYQQFNRNESPHDWEKKDFPSSDRYVLEPFRYFADKAKTVDFPIHGLRDAFKNSGVFPVCLDGDPHWIQAGHDVATRAIVDAIVKDGFLH